MSSCLLHWTGHSPPDVTHQCPVVLARLFLMQSNAGCLCYKGSLLDHIQLLIHQDTQIFLWQLLSRWLSSSLYWYTGFFLTRCRTLLSPFHEVALCQFLLSAPPKSTECQHNHVVCINRSSQFFTMCQLVEGPHSPVSHVANENVKQY